MTNDVVQPLRRDRISLSMRAHQYLLGLVEDGTLRPGEQLPSQNELAAQLGISRATLREAMLNLEQEGIVIRKQGVGTFVAPGYEHRLDSGLEHLESTLEMAARQGMQLEFDALQVEEEPAGQNLADTLHVTPDTLVTSIRRILKADQAPIAFMLDVVPTTILSAVDIDGTFNGSVLDSLRHKPEIQIAQATANIVAVNADAALAESLQVGARQALLLMEEILFSPEGRVVGFSRNYFVPEFFQFHVVRR